MLKLYQAEWCPYSSAVREVLTELGLPFVAQPVEPDPADRATLEEVAGTGEIPVLQDEEGSIHRGCPEIFRYLEGRRGWQHGEAHRQKFVDHREERAEDRMGQLVEQFRARRGDEPAGGPDDAEVVHVPEETRYELRLGDRRVGHVAYFRRGDAIAFTHTEIDPACEGRGFGTRLVAGALADARREGLRVVPLCSFVAAYVRRHPEAVVD